MQRLGAVLPTKRLRQEQQAIEAERLRLFAERGTRALDVRPGHAPEVDDGVRRAPALAQGVEQRVVILRPLRIDGVGALVEPQTGPPHGIFSRPADEHETTRAIDDFEHSQ